MSKKRSGYGIPTIAEARQVALRAARCQLRRNGVDPTTVSADEALAVLDDMARNERTIATWWYIGATQRHVKQFRRDWQAWQKMEPV